MIAVETKKIKLEDLSKPFKEEDIEWRLQQSGITNGKPWAKCLAYITNRAIMDRLDEVCGPENWKNDYKDAPGGGILCGLSIRIGDEWVTKWDGAGQTDIEKVKGGLSSSMKRAGVQWGIGRYLYDLEATWADVSDKGKHSDKGKDGKYFKWNPPKLPSWALPKGEYKKPLSPTPEPTPEPEGEPKTTKNFKFLEHMKGQKKRVGDEAYYETLLTAGKGEYEKSNLITDEGEQVVIFRALLNLPNKEEV